MTTCQQKDCIAIATHTVYWPGQTTKQCDFHAKQLQALGTHMGFHVSIEPLEEDE